MTQRPRNPILEHIRSLAARGDSSTCDAELLRQFVSHREESAFETLLRRHGPMVLRVARRIAGNDADAEDVFQATFLLLARRADAIRKRESVAGWLHGVAHRLALSARSKRIRRQQCEKKAAAMRQVESAPESAWSELEETLHEVLSQLPAKYRTPLVYCYLEGRTQEEVARQLGKPLGTVRSWLARGRDMLHKRLLRRGIPLTTEGASAALLASACATAEAVPPMLRITTLQAVHLFATGGNAMTLFSPAVAALVQKGMATMLIAKLKSAAVCVLVLALLVAGSGWAAHRSFRAKPPEANENAEKAPPQQAAGEQRPRIDAFGDPLPPGAVARLGTIRFRHDESRSWQFAVSPDGRTLATAAGRNLILWDMATGKQQRRFPLGQIIRCLAYAPDGKSVAIGGEDCIVHRFNLVSGKETQRFDGHQARSDPQSPSWGIWGLAFASDGNKLISWGSDKTVRVWDARNSKELRQLGDKDFGSKDWSISSLSPDGKILAVSKTKPPQMRVFQGRLLEMLLQLWNLETGKEVRQETYPGAITTAFSPDGKILAVSHGSQVRPDPQITLRDVESGKEIRSTRNSGVKWGLGELAFAPDGKTLAAAGLGLSQLGSRVLLPCIHLWDVGSMKKIRTTPPASDSFNSISQLAFSPDGKTLISRNPENHVRLWDVASGKERITAEGPSQAIHCLAYSPNTKLLASAFGDRIWLWSAATGNMVRMLECSSHPVSTIGFCADGKTLVSVGMDGTVQLWDLQTGKEQHHFTIGGRQAHHAAVAPDGETIAVWSEDNPQTISLWNARTGKKARDMDLPPRGNLGGFMVLNELHFSSDGKILCAISGSHTHALRWDAASGKALPSFGERTGSPKGMALSPDGRSLAIITGGGGMITKKGMASWDGELYMWETATGQRRFTVKDVGYVDSIAFSPDGSLLALITARTTQLLDPQSNTAVPLGVDTLGQVRLVRVADGKIIHRFTGHLGGINAVSFSPDGRTLASGGQDTTVLLWDVAKLRKNAVIQAPPLTPEKLADLWKGLRGTAAEAYGCMNLLIAAPGQAVPFLGEKLKPIATVKEQRVLELLKKLDSDRFAEREEATLELKKIAASAETILRKAIQDKPTPESRRRLQALLDDLQDKRLRFLRAIEALERIGDKPACDLLRRLSEGAAGAWLTEEARMSLRRLGKNSA